MTPDDVLRFWFEELQPGQWFKSDPVVDVEIRRRFGALHEELRAATPGRWSTDARSALAAVIVLDQFSRNMFRGTPGAFAGDEAALSLACAAIEKGFDRQLTQTERWFFYMPFEHSEDLAMQVRSMELFESLGDAVAVKYARGHHDIIARFGRFPHRNAILGRASTPEEIVFLNEPGSSY